MADGFVLAEHASQRAAAEKHRAAAPRAADAGLLPQVGRGAGHHRQRSHMAVALAAVGGAHGVAPSGTQVAKGHPNRLLSHRGRCGQCNTAGRGCKAEPKDSKCFILEGML